MDLSTITDIDKLKVLAYDQLVAKEQAENNLRMINQRIQEISSAEEEAKNKK